MLTKWLKLSKTLHSLQKLFTISQKLIFRQMFAPLAKKAVKSYLLSQEE